MNINSFKPCTKNEEFFSTILNIYSRAWVKSRVGFEQALPLPQRSIYRKASPSDKICPYVLRRKTILCFKIVSCALLHLTLYFIIWAKSSPFYWTSVWSSIYSRRLYVSRRLNWVAVFAHIPVSLTVIFLNRNFTGMLEDKHKAIILCQVWLNVLALQQPNSVFTSKRHSQ